MSLDVLNGILTEYQTNRSIPDQPVFLGNLFSMRLGDRLERPIQPLFSWTENFKKATAEIDPAFFLDQGKVLIADVSTKRDDKCYAIFTRVQIEKFANARNSWQEDFAVAWYLLPKDVFVSK